MSHWRRNEFGTFTRWNLLIKLLRDRINLNSKSTALPFASGNPSIFRLWESNKTLQLHFYPILTKYSTLHK